MANANERKALFFLAIVALSGGAVRLWQSDPAPDPDNAAAIARQIGRIDSVKAAPRASKGASSRKGKRKAGKPDSSSRVIAPAAVADLQSPGGATAAVSVAPALVDLDRADASTIEALPGIGPALARRIVAHRDSAGLFGGMAAFCDVRGIGPAMAKRLGPLVTFSGGPRPLSDECGGGSRQARKTSAASNPKPR